MSIIVQKYGGTSVATNESREKIADNAIKLINEGKKPVIVVSAIGRKGDPYATDTLLSLFGDKGIEVDSREMDMLLSCGETISSVVLANVIKARGYKTVALTGYQAGILTDANHGNAKVIKVNPDRIHGLLDQGNIVIVTGFQGISEIGDITTLGRGGSDTTAAILGEALNADAIEIYTDVDGIMTADPRVVSEAKVIDKISYDEIYQLAVYGAKVVDHNAVAVAKRSGKVLKIKNTFSDAEGTMITSSNVAHDVVDTYNSQVLLTAITSKENVVQFDVRLGREDQGEKLLHKLDDFSVSIDLINFFEDRKIFTVNSADKMRVEQLLKELGATYEYSEDCSKVTVVGHKIHGAPGVMKRIVIALSKAGIEILQSSDSHTTISCLVRKNNANKAINVLHDEFELN